VINSYYKYRQEKGSFQRQKINNVLYVEIFINYNNLIFRLLKYDLISYCYQVDKMREREEGKKLVLISEDQLLQIKIAGNSKN